MTLGRTTENKIKIKTDGGLRAVECACCNPGPCGGCPTILGALPATGTPPVRPTSIAWQATFGGEVIDDCYTAVLSGTISEGECSITASSCKSVDTPDFYTNEGERFYYQALLYVTATLQIGKFKKKTRPLVNACGQFNYDFIRGTGKNMDRRSMSDIGKDFGLRKLETDPESECALWFSIGVDSVFDSYSNEGACGYVWPEAAGTGNIFGPIPLTSIIGTHSGSGTFVISRPAVGIGEEGEAIPYCSCGNGNSYSAQVSASITIS
jgi:hypothetical protein